MSPRAWAARALLDLSGHIGALGPILATATARCAEALADAALWASPLAECPGCGGAVPSLDLEVVGVCGECAEREAVGPPTFPAFGPPDDASEADADAFWLALLTSHDAPRVNVYHHRSSKPEEPS